MPSPAEQLDLLRRGVVTLTTEEELLKMLGRGKPLRVKLGVDPTAPDIHLGHTVVLRKLRQFQDLGHQGVLIIGDFTALIGDPTGRSKTRPQLTPEQVDANAKTYLDQVGKVADLSKLEIVRNSEWLKPLSFYDLVQITAKLTVARFLERDDFQKRYREGTPIGLHEFLYCVMQAYDSVVVRADVELGGTDQTFNLMVGRNLQRDMGQEPQALLTTPILVGITGDVKMSKSYGNHIGVAESPDEMYGKIMKVPDGVMADYFPLLTSTPLDEVKRLADPKLTHPRQAKDRLARTVVEGFHGAAGAAEASAKFERTFTKREMPESIPEAVVRPEDLKDGRLLNVPKLLVRLGEAASNSDGRRLVEQGGVQTAPGRDGALAKLDRDRMDLEPADGMILCVGKKKRFYTIRMDRK